MEIALAIILHPNKAAVLISQRRPDAHLPNLWEFPGGKCLLGETAPNCAVREAREETGLDITILEAWPAIFHIYPERVVTLYPFLCRAASANAEARASQAVAWVQPEELDAYDFPEANAPLLRRLKSVTFTG